MKNILILSLTLLAVCGSICAESTQIDGLYYSLNFKTKTAEVTYQSRHPAAGDASYNKNWDISVAIIPPTITHRNVKYKVVAIGANAFMQCQQLKSVVIPNSVTFIKEYAFSDCQKLAKVTFSDNITFIGNGAFFNCCSLPEITLPINLKTIGYQSFYQCANLTRIVIPEGVTTIGTMAFAGCKALKSVIIPKNVSNVGRYAFPNNEKLFIQSASNTPIPDVTETHIISRSQKQLFFFYPFSIFAQIYVENGVNEWQKKSEFERISDWQKRVTEQSRQEKVKELLAEAEQKYLAYHSNSISTNPSLGKYDAENEVFLLNDTTFGNLYMAVPIDEAQSFKKNWYNKKLSYQMQIKDDSTVIASISVTMPNGKEYTYRNTDAVNYNLAEVEYNFDPLDINIPQSSTQTAQQGQHNITTTKIKAGKSAVDTDIPMFNASNPNTFVIIFANEDYKNVASVPFAKNDGSIFQKYCQRTLGIPTSNIHYVENASFNDMRIQLAWLNDVCNAFEGKASLIIYYAGHGIPDESSKSAYLLPVDGDGRYVQSAYKLDEMYQKLGNMNAKSVTVFMDACFSGSKREEGMLASARGVALKAKSGVPQGNMVVFSAASGDETAYPNNDEQHGMFTYYLLKKLQETQGDVTLQELGNYITTNVRQQSIVKNGKPQTPCVTPSSTLDASWQNWKLK